MTRYEILKEKLESYEGSMVALAEKAGVTRSYLYMIKDGKTKRPGSDIVDKLIAALSCEQGAA